MNEAGTIYQPRFYRNWTSNKDLVAFQVVEKETDLRVEATRNLRAMAQRLVAKYRQQIERYIARDPDFLTALTPIEAAPGAPAIVLEMVSASARAGVGPMAAVAGVIAERVGKELMRSSKEVIVENGGDIFMKTVQTRTVGVFAGISPLTGKLALEVDPGDTPLGICTSSGTVGHSLSFGTTDATIVVSRETGLADATATAAGNLVLNAEDIEKAIDFARGIEGVLGIVIIKGENLAAWGRVKLLSTYRLA